MGFMDTNGAADRTANAKPFTDRQGVAVSAILLTMAAESESDAVHKLAGMAIGGSPDAWKALFEMFREELFKLTTK